MANSSEELLEKLAEKRGFDFIILDDTFDTIKPDGEPLYAGPTIPEILQKTQNEYVQNSEATFLCLLRPCREQMQHGINSFHAEAPVEDRKQSYIELGAYNFLEKPFTIEKLNQTLESAIALAKKPPQWLTLLKQIRSLVAQKKLNEALVILSKLRDLGMEKEHLGFAILRAQVLSLLGGDHLNEANIVLCELEERNPNSISIRLNHLENAMKLQNYTEAFEVQLSIFEHQKTASNFEKILALLHRIDQALSTDIDTSGPPPREVMLISHTIKLFDTLLKDPAPYSRKLRPRILELAVTRTQHHESCFQLLKLFEQTKDVVDETLPALRRLLSNLKPSATDSYPSILEAYENAHFQLLEADPLDPQAIDICCQKLFSTGSLEPILKLLEKSHEAGAKCLEFYTNYSEYFLRLGELKAASDTLHKAVQIQADNPRVLRLRESWQQAYNAKAP